MKEQWKPEDVENIVANPMYVGIGQYPRIISDEQWIAAFSQLMTEVGKAESLKLLIANLRKSFGDSR